MNPVLIIVAATLALAAVTPAMAQGIHCTQDGLWGAKCSDSRGNVVRGDATGESGSLLSFGKGDSTRCAVDAAGNATCNVAGKSFTGSPEMLGATRTGESRGKQQRCTADVTGVQHCSDGGWFGQKCIPDGMGGSRCSWEWAAGGSR